MKLQQTSLCMLLSLLFVRTWTQNATSSMTSIDDAANIAPRSNPSREPTQIVVDSSSEDKETGPFAETRPDKDHSDNQERLVSETRQETPLGLKIESASVTQKRNAKGGKITVTSHLDTLLLEEEDEDDQSTENAAEQCTFTFVVPKQPLSNPYACVKPPLSEPSQSNEFFTKLHRDVFEAKSQIEEIRSEIIEEKQRFPSQATVDGLEENVNLLQQEARNMDSRVSQLYMQLLHEIINKRDNTLEVQRIESKLLNQTVEYHKLKGEHDQLKRDHLGMQEQIQEQAEQLEKLKKIVTALKNQKILPHCPSEVSRRRKPSWGSKHVPAPTTLPSPRTPLTPLTLGMRSGPFRDCTEVQRAGYTKSGIFNLRIPNHEQRIRVWCDFEQDPGGWIVIQRRTGRRISFYRNMEAYKQGFGRPHSDFWLGLERIHKLTNQAGVNYKLHIDLEDWNEKRTFVEYQSFRVEGEDTDYRLRTTHYSGNAGDSLTWHNNMKFTTKDEDNDPFETNCANHHKGGWWYNACARSNLNGIYYRGGIYRSQQQDGIFWSDWRGKSYSLKSVSMKIMPTE